MRYRTFKGLLASLVLGVAALLTVCSGNDHVDGPDATAKTNWDREKAEKEYRLVQTELWLANTGQAYLVLDFLTHKLELRLRATTVWEAPMTFAEPDSEAALEFAGEFARRGVSPARTITRTHLFEATTKVPDSILSIVAEAVNVTTDKLRRELPERFRIGWGDGLFLEIVTDIEGQPVNALLNSLENIRSVVSRPFGSTGLVLRLDAAKAMTLYGVCKPGIITLVIA